MDRALSELIEISNAVGKDRSLVQGVGGNTSVKSDDGKYTYIKASGTALKDMTLNKGWRRLRTEEVKGIFLDKALGRMDVPTRESEMVVRLQSACDDDVTSGARPSVESPLHVICDKCVIHVHAFSALAYACAKNGRARILEMFSDELHPPLWVPYADPGYSLGRKASSQVRNYQKQHARNPSIMFLEKHGLLVASRSAERAMKLLRKVIARCEAGLEPLGAAKASTPKQQDIDRIKQTLTQVILNVTGDDVPVSYYSDEIVSAALARKDLRKLLGPVALSPDEMGFVNGPIILLKNYAPEYLADRIRALLTKGQRAPIALLLKDVGLFIAASDKMAEIISEIVIGSLFVRIHAQYMGGINALNKQQRAFINNWEAEKFRIQLAGR